ncbi:MAG: phytoene/squalene synthase family protein [Thermomicrobium sp.]|nr:phytoene/squalene synthase family protein [Thermomicrobium sp.]
MLGTIPATDSTTTQLWRSILARHGRSFWLASRLLPVPVRAPVTVLYAFFRTLDDIVDRTTDPDQAAALLTSWETWLDSGFQNPAPDPQLADTVAAIFTTYCIDRRFPRDLIAGLHADLARPRRIRTYPELLHYCYQVAGTVGLALAPILGVHCASGREAARALGIAMQLTNIVRDLGEDLRMGRLYVPLEDVRRFGLGEATLFQLAHGRASPPPELRALLRLQILRARRYYRQAARHYGCLPDQVRPGIIAAAELYAAILETVEELDYDTLRVRAVVAFDRKLLALGRAFVAARRLRTGGCVPCPTCG